MGMAKCLPLRLPPVVPDREPNLAMSQQRMVVLPADPASMTQEERVRVEATTTQNDARVEQAWVVSAMKFAETYLKLIKTVPNTRILRLTGSIKAARSRKAANRI